MITTSRQPAAQRPTNIFNSIGATVRWPFTSRYAAPIWFALRLYVGYIWLQFSISKFSAGWLTSDPIGGLFKQVANGVLAVPFAFYRDLAAFLLHSGMTPLISHTMPFLELAVALSFFSGVLVRPAAIGGILLVINIILTGVGTLTFDGRIILFHLLLILAWQVAGVIGLERLAVRILGAIVATVRPKARVAGLARK
jgi:hypothetical protein